LVVKNDISWPISSILQKIANKLNNWTSRYDGVNRGLFQDAHHVEQINFHNNLPQLCVWDTVGGGPNCGFDSKEESKALRELYYKNADIIILCYSIDDINSFIQMKEYKENVNIPTF
jgi:GTPase SAR1 family protein